MAGASETTNKRTRSKGKRDLGRAFAVVLFVVFAVIGAVPLSIGVLVRTQFVRNVAAIEAAKLVKRELGITARYSVKVEAWPMALDLEDVVVDASDGGSPFLQVERVGLRPHVFALLGGELDIGEIEILGPRIRAVVKDGLLENLHYTLPAPSSEKAGKPPFSGLAITDADLDITAGDMHVVAHEVDIDVSAEKDSAYELALRAGPSAIVRTHPMPGRQDEDAVDEDVLCRLDARVRLDETSVLVRRLRLVGAADLDPDPGTSPSCELGEGDWRSLELNLGAFRVALPKGEKSEQSETAKKTIENATPSIPNLSGRIHARLPIPLVHRFIATPWLTGAIDLNLELEHKGTTTLPDAKGHLDADRPGLDGKVFATKLSTDVSIENDVIRLSKVDIDWADGKAAIQDVKIEPFAEGAPLSAGPIDLRDIQFTGVMRDLGVHPQSHVTWVFDKGRFESFRGKLSPLALEGPMDIQTHGFEIFDKPASDPTRNHMLAVAEGRLRGTFAVRPNGILLDDVSIETPKSELRTRVMLLFKSVLDVEVFKGSHVDLSELSPIKNLPIAGIAELSALAKGPFSKPAVDAEVAIKGFEFSTFSFGDLESAHAHFEPFDLTISDAHIRKGDSKIRAPEVHIDFDAGPNVVVDASIDTQNHPHLWLRDLYKILHIDEDPRFAEIDGNASGTARAHFVVGGPEDACGGGRLRLKSRMHLEEISLFGEKYEDGEIDFDFDWLDREASAAGMSLDVHSATLRKGTGSVLANLAIRPGGRLTGQAIATGIPIDHLDTLGRWGKRLDGSVSAVANISGTVSQIEANADISITPIRIASSSLPASSLRLFMTSEGTAPHIIGWTRCHNPRTAPFDRGEFDRDPSGGNFRVDGSIAGGQMLLEDVRVSRQRHKLVTGKIKTRDLDIGTLANLIPGVAFSQTPPHGKLDATIDLKKLPLDDLQKSEVTLNIAALNLERGGKSLELEEATGPIVIKNNALTLPSLRIRAESGSGLSAPLIASGKVDKLVTNPELDLGLSIGPLDLSRLSADIPSVTRASGSLAANLRIQGTPSALRYSGSARLRNGELALSGLPVSLDDIEVDVAVSSTEARILRGFARVGGGEVSVTGRLPIRGFELGTAEAAIKARGVKMPVAEGVNLTADADLAVTLKPTPADEAEREAKNLPEVKGTISLTSFTYARPINLSLDLNQLAGGPKRTAVETYDPKEDALRFDVVVVSPRPLRFSNNLVDMQLEVAAPGLNLSGTNQRYGARGSLRILPDSKLRLRNSEFTVREGSVRFDDPLRFSPKVDVRAQTEYRRYAASGSASADPSTTTTSAATASLGQQWRINLYAHGDEQNLKLDLTSDPPLSQEDIVLLLTVGLTRAEMDRGLATNIGETVGLEALAQLTGADKAIKTMVPIIDEFRFGTAYSSRTGRTEPTVTLGKRITNDIRATVTTGITENREVRSSIEWRLGKRLILQGAYDNTNDVSSSPLGNMGIDLRWRIEFE